MDQELERFQRRLPHWRQAGAYFFVTWRVQRGRTPLAAKEKDTMADALLHFQDERYRLLAYVVMDDHVHVVVRPAGNHNLSSILHSWKSFTAHQINRLRGETGALWQDENYERIVRTESDLLEKMEYVVTNPERKWPGAAEYPWRGWFPDD